MKEIKIFLASSIDEFKNERNELQCFINDVAEDFRDRYDTDIRVQRCEKVDPRYVKGRSQDEFNELIKNSEMCIFLFFTKAGEYTIEEFEVARRAFEASENDKPKIYTYFKTVNDIRVEKSVTDFMSELDKNLKHFYQTFSHIDTVKLRILLNLKLQEMDFVSVEFDNGKCIVDGKETLDLSNVSDFANNSTLKQLNDEFLTVNKEYCEMKPIYAAGNADEVFCKKYAEIASKRQNLLDTLEELQKNIFNISLQMCKDDVYGEITQRQKEAYRLFELGDLDGCISVLDSKNIDNDFLRVEKHLEEMAKKNAQKYIREHKTAIDILKTMINYRNRFNEIEERYEKIVPVAEKYLVELDVINDYGCFLVQQNKIRKALEILIILERICLNKQIQVDFIIKMKLYNLLGTVYTNFKNSPEKSLECFYESIKFNKMIQIRNIEWDYCLASAYGNVSGVYLAQKDYEEAKLYIDKSIKLRKKFVKVNQEEYGISLAVDYSNKGNIYFANGNVNVAQKYYIKAINITKSIYCNEFLELISNNYCQLAQIYEESRIFGRAEKYYLDAIIYQKKMVVKNPRKFGIGLADRYYNFAAFCNKTKRYKEAKKYCFMSLELLEKYLENNEVVYRQELAMNYNLAGNIYFSERNLEEAEKFYIKTIALFEELAKENNNRYNDTLIKIYKNISMLYKSKGDISEASRYFYKALELVKT